MLSEKRKEEVINLCQELIRIKSYSGEEGELAEKLKNTFLEMGFDETFIDSYGNVIGHIKGKNSGKCILLDGHIDTVPVDESKWTKDPFGGEIESGRIYGRGASDMKGAVSAMVCAAAYFAEDMKKDFNGDIYVAGVVHEECFEGVAARKISEKVKPDYVIIGEASECNLKRGQRGRAEIVVETYGKAAHSSNPQNGINAVYNMMKLLEKIRKIKVNHHEVLGDGILELTDIISSPYPGASVLPSLCRVTFDRRLLVGETPESVLKPIQEIIVQMENEDPNFKAKVYFAKGEERCYTGEKIMAERFFPAWLFDVEEDFVKKAYQGLKEQGLEPAITHYSFCTNGSHYAGEANIKTIGFGPSKENLAHIDDEYIEIDQLLKAVRGYYGIIKALLS
ncbi:MAG: YgeY family selenium metabolism-linked hydrolase [Thermovenabulum sp.]|uniref:YgeY family selenium metabolism-linked hydrolase n=1 Tax=Thermovenabulum sp. TaxID=3100335 RepID=UPI003C7A4B1B